MSDSPAARFYDHLAADYDAHFDAPHRKAYDDLCWEHVDRLLDNASPSTIVDVGCGVGRWAEPLVERGHHVIGIEPSSAMVDQARARGLGDRFEIQHCDADAAVVAPGSADLVMALGSIQYSPDPAASIGTMASWLSPGGRLVVLMDSLIGLVAELLRRDDLAQAIERLQTGRGVFRSDAGEAEHALFNSRTLRAAFVDAGLVDISVHGLLVDWSVRERDDAVHRLTNAWDDTMAAERALAEHEAAADLGKQLLAIGTKASIA